MGHWYDKDGFPMYEVPKKTSKTGEMRATTLRDARKLNLYPSVTTITKVAAKPGLTRWIEEQAIMAALTGESQRNGEDEKAYIKRVLLDAKEQVIQAADRGTILHNELEKGLNNEEVHINYREYVDPVLDYIHDTYGSEGYYTEKTFTNLHLGFAGKSDLIIVPPNQAVKFMVIDFKSKDKLEEKKNKAQYVFKEQAMQLAGYTVGNELDLERTRLINIFLSTSEPNYFKVHEWPSEDNELHWNKFRHLLEFWKLDNSYDPSRKDDKHEQ